MKTIQRLILTWAIMMMANIITMPDAHAKDQAAVVIIAAGDFFAVDKQQNKRPLQRRSKVYVGDILVTGKNGRGQVRFIDGAILSLRPDTELDIKKYSYGKSKADEGSLMTLIKGGFRTITGAISKKKYKVTTAMATIGIRGTHYEAVIDNKQLFVALWHGGVTVANSAGQIDLGLGADYNFGMVQGQNIEPQGQIDPPDAIVNNNEPQIAPDLSSQKNNSTTIAADSPSLVDDIANDPDTPTIMPTSGAPTYTNTSVSATGSTNSISGFNYSAKVDFAAATISGSMSFNSTSGTGSHDWAIKFSGGPSSGNGVSGTNFSMDVDSSQSLVDGLDKVTGTISGNFAGKNAKKMVGSFSVADQTDSSVKAEGDFTATQ